MKHRNLVSAKQGLVDTNGTYLFELEAQPGGPEGRPHTTTGSKPKSITGRPRGVRPCSPLLVGRPCHPVPSPVSTSKPQPADPAPCPVTVSAASLPFNHARYDAESRMVSSSLEVNGFTTTTAYVFDGEGRRVKKDGTYFVYDAFGNLAAEYGATPDAAGRQYLTMDHLGSTRVVTNGTGGVERRYDYAPFGEEIYAGTGGRTTAMGYQAVPDKVNPRFTGKERDQETGLDFFGARYMSPAQGRFTSPDPVRWLAWQHGGSNEKQRFMQHISDPQRFNLYAYGRNNPLRYIDPSGMYICKGSNEDCGAVQVALENIKQAARKLSSSDANKSAALQRVATFYGDPGKKNGVVVQIGEAGGNMGNATTGRRGTTITLDTPRISATFADRGDGSTVVAETSAIVAHEGQHGIDQRAKGMPNTRATEKAQELGAFTTQGLVNEGLGVNSAYGI